MTGCVVIALSVLIALECWDPRFRHDLCRDRARLFRNLGFVCAGILVMLLVRAVEPALRAVMPSLLVWPDPRLELVMCFMVADGLGYASHRIKHDVPWLWNFHFQHHRDNHYGIWMATHTHALEVFVSGLLITIIQLMLGFSADSLTVYMGFYTVVKVYHHSAHDYSLGWLDGLIISPRYHRLHHEINSRCNYGNTLTVFDACFGTLRWPEGAVSGQPLGLDPREEKPFGFVREMLFFLKPMPVVARRSIPRNSVAAAEDRPARRKSA